jgi:TRAP-type C4-dicarboxylate transport system permease small subunit
MNVITAGPSVRDTTGAAMLSFVRRGLDLLYTTSAYLAAASMATIFGLTIAQMVCRVLALNVRGLSDYAGYFMAASAFLAFAHTLNHGSHIRIEIFASFLGRYRVYAEAWALACSAAIAGWFTWYAWSMVYWSFKLGDISTGMDATPLWIPQMAMATGSALFTLALIDNLVQLIWCGKHIIQTSSEAV